MSAAHAQSFSAIRGVSIVACCDIDEKKARAFAREWGIPRWYLDYDEFLATEELDAVSVVTMDIMHAPISLAAIARRRAVLCEKPLATTLADARAMRNAARKAKVVTHVNFAYRSAGGAQAAAAFIRDGGIGRVMHVEASYLQSWLIQDLWGPWRTDPAWTWRLSKRHGSGGVLADVGCHIYDLTTLLCGDIAEISCRLQTFDKGIKGNRIGPYVLDASDSFVSTVVLAGGGLGTIHASRWAAGHINSLRVRVYGEEGGVEVDLDRSRESYRVSRGKKLLRSGEWKEVPAKKAANQYERFVAAVRAGESDECDFANGARVQAYLDASELSHEQGRPVKVAL
jgi:predicted dehydrogenase